MTNPTDGPIHLWFGLSYTNYQVLHRALMQSMPTEWQERMVACLEELQAAYEHIGQPEVFKVEAATEHIVNEMTEEQLGDAGIEADWYDEPVPEDYGPFDLAEWRAEHEKDAPTYHDRDGNEVDPHQRVLLPVADPVPHYRHAYIEPRIAAREDAVPPAPVDTIGLCGYCGVPRETHHHGYVSTAASLAAAPRLITADEAALIDRIEAAKKQAAAEEQAGPENPRAVCTCGHTRGEHVTVSGRLLCDVCDPDSTDNLVCKEYDEL